MPTLNAVTRLHDLDGRTDDADGRVEGAVEEAGEEDEQQGLHPAARPKPGGVAAKGGARHARREVAAKRGWPACEGCMRNVMFVSLDTLARRDGVRAASQGASALAMHCHSLQAKARAAHSTHRLFAPWPSSAPALAASSLERHSTRLPSAPIPTSLPPGCGGPPPRRPDRRTRTASRRSARAGTVPSTGTGSAPPAQQVPSTSPLEAFQAPIRQCLSSRTSSGGSCLWFGQCAAAPTPRRRRDAHLSTSTGPPNTGQRR